MRFSFGKYGCFCRIYILLPLAFPIAGGILTTTGLLSAGFFSYKAYKQHTAVKALRSEGNVYFENILGPFTLEDVNNYTP